MKFTRVTENLKIQWEFNLLRADSREVIEFEINNLADRDSESIMLYARKFSKHTKYEGYFPVYSPRDGLQVFRVEFFKKMELKCPIFSFLCFGNDIIKVSGFLCLDCASNLQ